MNVICPKCSSEYELSKIKIPMRDKDSIHCDICGEKLYSWNGAEMWNSKMIKKGEVKREHK